MTNSVIELIMQISSTVHHDRMLEVAVKPLENMFESILFLSQPKYEDIFLDFTYSFKLIRYRASSFEMPLCPQILDKLGNFCLVMTPDSVNSPKIWSHKLFYLTMHCKAPPMATPISIPNLTRKNVVLQSSRYERSTLI